MADKKLKVIDKNTKTIDRTAKIIDSLRKVIDRPVKAINSDVNKTAWAWRPRGGSSVHKQKVLVGAPF
ncbi:hypothetical protein [Priestia koreensis]|nr:hypothetical protein [Priestia koreensis]